MTTAPPAPHHTVASTCRTRRTHSFGFTLIELLIVIDIIVVLAAILFPIFAHAHEKARQTTCLSNMRQLGLAFQQYTGDYDDTLPFGASFGANKSNRTYQNTLLGSGWAGRIAPYSPSPGIYRCPDDFDTQPLPATFAGKNYTLYPVSYAYNSNLMGQPNWSMTRGTLGILGHIPQLTAPASTVMLCEVTSFRFPDNNRDDLSYADLSTPDEVGDQGLVAGGGSCSVGSAGSLGGMNAEVYGCYIPQATGYTGGGAVLDDTRKGAQVPCNNSTTFCGYGLLSATGRHSGGSNYLLCDGHAKWLRGDAVGTGYTFPAVAKPTDNEDQPYMTITTSPTAPGTASTQGATPGSPPFAVTFSPI